MIGVDRVEIDSIVRHPFTSGGIVPERFENVEQAVYQGLHHQFVASALAVKYCHEIIPGSQIGCMLTKLNNIHPTMACYCSAGKT